MIRYPKKNIAQQQAERKLNPKKEAKETSKEIVKSTGTSISQSDLHDLYPKELYQLHQDIESLENLNRIPLKEKQELLRRLPISLDQAENRADLMIKKFLQKKINHNLIETYNETLKKSITPKISLLLAIRCWIAANTDRSKPVDKIKIYRNKSMNSWDFFPASARKIMIDKDGSQQVYIDYEGKEDDPYFRQSDFKSTRHSKVGEIEGNKPKKEDFLPSNWSELMDQVLKGYGHTLTNTDEAWKLLSQVSKTASIEEKILSKISYMIVHASVK